MRINEIITEDQELDELSLAGGINRTATGVGKVVGGVKGAWQGAKDVYSQSRDATQSAARTAVARRSPQAGGTATSGTTAASMSPTTPSASLGTASPSAPSATVTPSTAAAPQSVAAQSTTNAPVVGPMRATEITSKLQSVWGQATADQGSETTSRAVQSQIKAMAKQAGMTGQTIAEFHSKFLGMHI